MIVESEWGSEDVLVEPGQVDNETGGPLSGRGTANRRERKQG